VHRLAVSRREWNQHVGFSRKPNKMIMKKLILTSSFLLLTSYFAPAATVEAEGRAPGDMKTARELTNFSK
jgi:hypothetical protein